MTLERITSLFPAAAALCLLFLPGPLEASYRVYRLEATRLAYDGRPTGKPYVLLTTLDPIQYEQFTGAGSRVRARLLDTWFCPGDTGRFRPYCEKPRVKDRAPATEDKRVPLPYERQPVIP